ncbi:uncharacterized protein LOC130892849 [Diorhabda carinulata]|uniref:uncharacterized protein LOC130892849 n=1 Tax=Diorhabda carinulata TaxID=1163345 RepID=UPI0025A25776|nr:uncharacterized protein LOC130892849 [Diorhabda carinulata]
MVKSNQINYSAENFIPNEYSADPYFHSMYCLMHLQSKPSSASSLAVESATSNRNELNITTDDDGVDDDADRSYQNLEREAAVDDDDLTDEAAAMDTSDEDEQQSNTGNSAEDRCSAQNVAQDGDNEKNDAVCIFCNKKRKKIRDREQQLQKCLMGSVIDTIKCEASEMGDEDLKEK